MLKNILKIIVIFIFGMAGGIFASEILWPYFGAPHFFKKWGGYQYQLANIPVPVTETKEIIIQENTALQNAVEKVEKAVVGIRTELKTGEILSGSGLIVTSDGLIVTLAELVPRGGDFVFFVDGETPNWQILKRDLKNNLALVKIEAENLQSCGFANFEEMRLGQRVFLLGVIPPKKGEGRAPLKMVNEGIVRFFTQSYIQTNIFEKYSLAGSPLFNIQGELLGLNTIDSEGKVTAIPVPVIRQFVGF